MKNKKIIIYIVAAVLVLGLGIFLGIMFSKGGDEDVNDDNTRLVENTSNNTDTSVKNSDGSSNSSATKQNDADGDGIDDNTEVKASDIGQPIMPGDKQAEDTSDNTSQDINTETDDNSESTSGNNDGDNKASETDSGDNNKKGSEVKNSDSVDNSKPDKGTDTENTDNTDNTGKNSDKVSDEDKERGSDIGGDAGTGNEDNQNTDKSDLSTDTGNDDSDNNSAENDNKSNNDTDNTDSGNDKASDNDDSKVNKPQEVIIAKPVSVINTGNLTEKGNGYEGTKGTGKYNYGEALQKSLLFYELQRSGKLPDKVRCNWRGDSGLNDGKDNGLDLTGGWYDAGDNVKFNLPMSYTSSMLGWSIIEDAKAYEESGQLSYALGNIKWANDYFIKCHPSDEVYYYQVGDGNQDHSYWGAAETVEYRMSRPSYKVTKSNPGSAVCGETAASLAICSIIYKNIDKSYSDLCLKHAKSLYKFARDTKSDAGYTAANGFYNSWSGFYDELAWSGAWLYCATGDETYITNAEADYKNAGHDYDWAMCWDDVHIGAAVMLAKLTEKDVYLIGIFKPYHLFTKGFGMA